MRKPLLLARERLELADGKLPGAIQPYHAIETLPLAAAGARLAVFRESAAALAVSGVGALVETARAGGIEPIAAGILDSAGRDPGGLEAILASHALIHTADGNHFREALAGACAALRLPLARIRQRDLSAEAVRALRRTSPELAASVARLGRAAGAPWGADQKNAALLAWLLFARGI